mgnify:CR=1 FL=1
MAVIQIEHLTKDYGHHRGIFDISFQVERGEVYGFLGPNGAGKTTTIRHIMGFSRPQRGRAFVNGLDCWKQASTIQRTLGYLPGELALPDSMTGTRFLRMMADLRGVSDMTYTNQLLRTFDLDPAGQLKRMSLGMKRKLAIVAAFMHDPDVLILDEPTSGLDPIMQDQFIEFLKQQKEKGKTILLSSHLFNEVEATCDTISIIKEGRLVSTFAAEELRRREEKTFELELRSSEQFQQFCQEVQNHADVELVSVQPDQRQVKLMVRKGKINEFIRLLSGYDLNYMSEVPFTLEDYFMKFYDRNPIQDGGGNPHAVH